MVPPPPQPPRIRGTLEVLLERAQDLKRLDGSTDDLHPYAILTCGLEKKESTVAEGPKPEWKERFTFDIYCGIQKLAIVVMDQQRICGPADFLGEVIIDLGPVFAKGEIPPTWYKLLPSGEIKVGLKFKPIFT